MIMLMMLISVFFKLFAERYQKILIHHKSKEIKVLVGLARRRRRHFWFPALHSFHDFLEFQNDFLNNFLGWEQIFKKISKKNVPTGFEKIPKGTDLKKSYPVGY